MEDSIELFMLKRANERKKQKLSSEEIVELEELKRSSSFRAMIARSKPSWIEEGLSTHYMKSLEEDMALGILDRNKNLKTSE